MRKCRVTAAKRIVQNSKANENVKKYKYKYYILDYIQQCALVHMYIWNGSEI